MLVVASRALAAAADRAAARELSKIGYLELFRRLSGRGSLEWPERSGRRCGASHARARARLVAGSRFSLVDLVPVVWSP